MCICSFCGRSMDFRRYSRHLEVAHPNGRLWQPFNNAPRKDWVQLLLEDDVLILMQDWVQLLLEDDADTDA
jgi:hypothetical protein